MSHLYNEIEPNAGEWMQNLMDAGEIPQGKIDARSIVQLAGDDFKGVTQFHTFAGIGGWPLALRLAGWPEDREVWTGSCPCQPFSSAGKGKGIADERHLWPEFYRLIKERRPATVFGEQVGSKAGVDWLDGVFADLERKGYACGAVIVGAHSVGAPHIRQRIYWCASLDGRIQHPASDGRDERWSESGGRGPVARRPVDGLGENPDGIGRGRGRGRDGDSPRDDGQVQAPGLRAVGRMVNDDEGGREGAGLPSLGRRSTSKSDAPRSGEARGLADDDDKRLEERGQGRAEQDGSAVVIGVSPWSDYRIVPCTDGKARRTGARVFPLAYGLPRGVGDGGAWRKGLARSASRSRIGMLKGSGNAIVPILAAEFIRAFLVVERMADGDGGGPGA